MIGLKEAAHGHRFRRFDFLPYQKANESHAGIIATALTITCHAA